MRLRLLYILIATGLSVATHAEAQDVRSQFECSRMIESVAREQRASERRLTDAAQDALLSVYARCLKIGPRSFSNPAGYVARTANRRQVELTKRDMMFVSGGGILEGILQDRAGDPGLSTAPDQIISSARLMAAEVRSAMSSDEITALLDKTVGEPVRATAQQMRMSASNVYKLQQSATSKMGAIMRQQVVNHEPEPGFFINFGIRLIQVVLIAALVGVGALLTTAFGSGPTLAANAEERREETETPARKDKARSYSPAQQPTPYYSNRPKPKETQAPQPVTEKKMVMARS